jgi:hypothetical protein
VAVRAEERHLPFLTKQGFDKSHYGEEQGHQIDPHLEEDHDEQTQEGQPPHRPVDDKERKKAYTFRDEEQKGLPGVKSNKGAFLALPQAEKAKKEEVPQRPVPPFVIGKG